jgi:hypothetical protein
MNGQDAEARNAMNAAARGMSSFVFYMIADIALVLGVVLVLFGIGDYISAVIGIAGIGKVILGILLAVSGMVILVRTRPSISIGLQQPMPPQPPANQAPPPEPPSGSYR